MIDFMSSVDRRYRETTGLTERRYFSIFYSQIVPAPVLILGYNPGGNPESWDGTEYSTPLSFVDGAHEYLDYDYPIAKVMSLFLIQALSLNDASPIRRIPKTNLIFRRSSNQDKLLLTTGKALAEAQPFVEEIIGRVNPRLIVLEGMSTYRRFLARYCADMLEDSRFAPINTPNGRNRAELFRLSKARVRSTNRVVALLGLGHPSRFGNRREWPKVVEQSKRVMLELGITL